jgi:hypothetical protein
MSFFVKCPEQRPVQGRFKKVQMCGQHRSQKTFYEFVNSEKKRKNLILLVFKKIFALPFEEIIWVIVL